MDGTQKTYDSNGTAIWAGIRDLNNRNEKSYDRLLDDDNLEGRTVLITGASSGLGLAVSKNLASRGARVLMVCRREARKELEAVRKAGLSGGGTAEVLFADMSDFSTIDKLLAELSEREEQVDVAISNAAIVCNSARRTVDGFEEMLQVNALAPVLLLKGLLKRGIIPNKSLDGKGRSAAGGPAPVPRPRIVVVASEAHRSSPDLNLGDLEKVEPYGMKDSTLRYGWTKLLLLTFTRELGRRLSDVGVHALCPGPVASNIAREAPAIARPFARIFFAMFFQPPEKAALPVVYLAASPRIEGQSKSYQFLMRRRPPSVCADSVENGERIWNTLESLLNGKNRDSA